MADLPTNYYDDILSASMNGKKKFRLTYRNGTTEEVTIEDISEYDQYGSKFGAGDINKTNQAVNEKFDSDDVVDPMLATESGYAADAYQTKLQFDEQNKKIEEYLKVKKQIGSNAYTLAKFSNTTKSITFPEAFGRIPTVTVTMIRQDWSDSGYDPYYTCTVSTVTETGFSVLMTSNIDQSTKVVVVWEATL